MVFYGHRTFPMACLNNISIFNEDSFSASSASFIVELSIKLKTCVFTFL